MIESQQEPIVSVLDVTTIFSVTWMTLFDVFSHSTPTAGSRLQRNAVVHKGCHEREVMTQRELLSKVRQKCTFEDFYTLTVATALATRLSQRASYTRFVELMPVQMAAVLLSMRKGEATGTVVLDSTN